MIPFQNIQIPGDPGNPQGTILSRIMQSLTATFGSLKNAVTNDHLVGNKPRTPGGPARIAIGTADTRIFHGLGATVTTWEVCDIDAAAIVYQSGSANPSPSQYIILKASAPCNVLLRFT